MFRRTLLFASLFTGSIIGVTQTLTISPGFGGYSHDDRSVNVVSDSLTVIRQHIGGMDNVYSINADWTFPGRRLSIQSGLHFTSKLPSYLVFNSQATCLFCDVRKSVSVRVSNLNFSIAPEYLIPQILPLNIYLHAGLRANWTFNHSSPDMYFTDGGNHTGLSEVVNNLDEVSNPLYFNTSIGVRVSYWRLSILAVWDRNISESITKDIEVFGKKYRFETNTKMVTVSLFYRLFPITEKK